MWKFENEDLQILLSSSELSVLSGLLPIPYITNAHFYYVSDTMLYEMYLIPYKVQPMLLCVTDVLREAQTRVAQALD